MAMRSLHSSVLLVTFALLIAALMLPRAESYHPCSVRIANQLPGVLGLHCRSRNDNLGQQYLPAGGTPYYFAFKENFWGTTLFWCTFNYGPVLWNSFTVWRGAGIVGDKQHCVHCLWVVRTDAFYRAEDSGTDPLVAIWPWRTDPHAMALDPQAQNASDLHNQLNETHSARDSALAANASQTVGS